MQIVGVVMRKSRPARPPRRAIFLNAKLSFVLTFAPMKSRLQPAVVAPEAPADAARSAEAALEQVEQQLHQAIVEAPAPPAAQSPPAESPPPAARATPAASAPPIPSARPLGRALIAITLAAGLLVAGSAVWANFFRYLAHGIVIARTAELPAPWAGTIETMHVRPGQLVGQGGLLATVTDPQIDAAIERIQDELRTARAELAAAAARLDAEAIAEQDRRLQLSSQYFEMLGRLGAESATAEELSASRNRLAPLVESSTVTEHEIESLAFRQAASRARVAAMQQTVDALADRLHHPPAQTTDDAQLRPWTARIEQLTGELARLKQQRERGLVRAPFAGQVVQVFGHQGESCSEDRPLLELLDTSSREVAVYVPPSRADRFKLGQRVQVSIDNVNALVDCKVVAIGPQYEVWPLQREDESVRPQRLLPVYLSLPRQLPAGATVHAGEAVHVPVAWGG